MKRTLLHRIALAVTLATCCAATAAAQSAVVEELAAFKPPYVILPSLAQLPDGRIYGFYQGGYNGAIYKVVNDGSGGFTTTLAYEFSEDQSGPTSEYGGRGTNAIAVDGKIYFAGRFALSRFDPDTNTVVDLHPLGSGTRLQLILGTDGHSLFGTDDSGRLYSYDTLTGDYRDLLQLAPGDRLAGVEQMRNGSLLLISTSNFDVHLRSIDSLTGVETAPAIVWGRANAYAPVRDTNGDTFVFLNDFGDQTIQRISTSCFCLEELQRWPFGSFFNATIAVRNGAVYIAPGGVPHRFVLATHQFDRLADVNVGSLQMLPDGTLAMITGTPARHLVFDTNTGVPGSGGLPVLATAMDNDGVDGFPTEWTEAADGALYGASNRTDTRRMAIFRIDPASSTRSLAATFDILCEPYCTAYSTYSKKMVLGPDGALYGTYAGVLSAIFRFDPATGAVTTLRSFPLDPNSGVGGPEGAYPQRLTVGSDGWLWGVMGLGDDPNTGAGWLFKIDPATGAYQSFKPAVAFPFFPTGPLFESAPGVWLGNYYRYDGSSDACGWIFRYDTNTGAFTELGELTLQVTGCPNNFVTFTRGADGSVFTTTYYGGTPLINDDFSTAGGGVLLKLDPGTGVFTKLHQFLYTDAIKGLTPDLSLGADGYLYSTYFNYLAGANYEKGIVRFNPATGDATPVAVIQTPGYIESTGFFIGRDGRLYGGTSSPTKAWAVGFIDSLPVAPASGPYGGSTSISASLDALGVPLAGRTITFTLNGRAIGSAMTNAAGVATLPNVSLNGIGVGTFANAVGASFAGDAHFPAAAGSGSLTVVNVPTPGLMIGNGLIRDDGQKYDFAFIVREKADGTDRGGFDLTVSQAPSPNAHAHKAKRRNDRFVARSFTSVVFSDDPSIRPGRPLRAQVDTVLFSGPGEWNGAVGYRFEGFAQDRGEPGRHHESLRVTIYDSANRIVMTFDDELSAGNIQSLRLRR